MKAFYMRPDRSFGLFSGMMYQFLPRSVPPWKFSSPLAFVCVNWTLHFTPMFVLREMACQPSSVCLRYWLSTYASRMTWSGVLLCILMVVLLPLPEDISWSLKLPGFGSYGAGPPLLQFSVHSFSMKTLTFFCGNTFTVLVKVVPCESFSQEPILVGFDCNTAACISLLYWFSTLSLTLISS